MNLFGIRPIARAAREVQHGGEDSDDRSSERDTGEHEQSRDRERGRERDHEVLVARVDDAVCTGVEHAAFPIRAERDARAGRREELEEHAVHEFMDDERRSRRDSRHGKPRDIVLKHGSSVLCGE